MPSTVDDYACNALVCEDELLLRMALRAVAMENAACRDRAFVVLSTLYRAPVTRFSDEISGQNRRLIVPRSPVAMSVRDIAKTFFFEHPRNAIVAIDSTDALQGRVPAGACVVVLSPPELRADGMLVRAGVWGPALESTVEYFVILRRDPDLWRVIRVERGMQT